MADLVVVAQQGDTTAFSELIRRYQRTALAVAFAITGDAHQAGDAAQEGFLRCWQRLRSLHRPACFGPWLVSIVRHAAHDQHRRAQRRTADSLTAAQPDRRPRSNPVALATSRELARTLDSALAALDETSRTAVVLRYYDNLSSNDIAELLDLSPSAVDMRLSRARQQLKGLLGGAEGTELPSWLSLGGAYE